MFEHVGKENLGEYFKDVANYLVPNGRALIHGITGQHYGAGVDPFIQKYIFPGGYSNIAENVTHIMEAGMQLDDIEPLRRHYQKTLETWTENYHAVYDKNSCRAWRSIRPCLGLIPKGSAASFESETLTLSSS